MNIGQALTGRIEDRIDDAVTKYFQHGYSGQVTIEKQGSWFECDCTIHLDSGVVLQARAKQNNANAAFDGAAEKIEKRLRRYKRRLKDHHPSNEGDAMAIYSVVESPSEEEIPENYNPAIIAESTTNLNTLTVAQAVMQLDMTDNPVVVFKHAANGETNVVYRRPDGNIGWIDSSRGS